MVLKIILTLFFSLLPPLIWLFFYLKRDSHPEPKKKILFAFFGGYLIAFPAFLAEQTFISYFNFLFLYPLFFVSLLAFFEEFLKFLVFKKTIEKDKEYDEPVDAMIYLITISLGFAGAENLFDFLKPNLTYFLFFQNALSRFLSSVFLHGLTGGILGFFLGLAFFKKKWIKKIMEAAGLFFATLSHSIYNLAILGNFGNIFITKLKIVFFLLVSLFCFILFAFRILKKIKK
ncbi:MAG: PrsW family glutamic-type intramembrane protease [Minisyncoccales bacterium]